MVVYHVVTRECFGETGADSTCSVSCLLSYLVGRTKQRDVVSSLCEMEFSED